MGFFSKPKPPPKPRPPQVIQYPNVLTPPQNGGLETIESYQYSEVIELLSDGPIYGLVNKNGVKVNGSNLFEGVYFNNSPIKETSDLNYNCFELISNHISSIIDKSWQSSIGREFQYSNAPLGIQLNAFCVKTYSPDVSLTFLSHSKTQEWLSSELSSTYSLFLTEICTPYIETSLTNKNIDTSDISSINLNIYNISEELYPKVCSDLFSLYSYFEMPESTVEYSLSRPSNLLPHLIKINGSIGANGFVRFRVWSVAKTINGSLMPIYDSDVLKKYFSFYANQNKKSLYNFNSVQVEFKNGSQYQNPISSIKNVDIDYKIEKSLIGPFIKNKPVRRLKSFLGDSSRPPYTNVSLEEEGSSDLRYVRSWPVEYDINNNPYLICNISMNYSDYDSTTKNILDQDAYPYTHYVVNQNAQCIYVSLSLISLYDTTHVDLAYDNLGLKTTKFNNTELVPQGTEKFCDLDYLKTASYFKKNVNPGTRGNPGEFGDNLEPNPCDFSTGFQSISVGTRLPTVVSFKVETGYETDSDGSKEFRTDSYYAYRYDIFGITQNPNVVLDFGRSNLNYLKYVYSYRSSTVNYPALVHLNPYTAYDPTIETKIQYSETLYKEWPGFTFIKVADEGNVYDIFTTSLTSNLFLSKQKQDLIQEYKNAESISFFTKITDEQLDIGVQIYQNDALNVPFSDGVGILQVVESYYAYEVINSKITRIGIAYLDTIVTTTPTTTPTITLTQTLPQDVFQIYGVSLQLNDGFDSITANGARYYAYEEEYKETFANSYEYQDFLYESFSGTLAELVGLKNAIDLIPLRFVTTSRFTVFNNDMKLKTPDGVLLSVGKINLLKKNTRLFDVGVNSSQSISKYEDVYYAASVTIQTPISNKSIFYKLTYNGINVSYIDVQYSIDVQQVYRLIRDNSGYIEKIEPVKTFNKPYIEKIFSYKDQWGNIIATFY